MYGLRVRSHMTAGQDGFRDASSKQESDLGRPLQFAECLASRIDRSHHLPFVLQVPGISLARSACRASVPADLYAAPAAAGWLVCMAL